MKIFGSHNTKSKDESFKHQVAKLFLDRNNGSMCINNRLIELLEIKKREISYVFFIEDDAGKLGLSKTEDKSKGIPLYWYKSDTRARMFNTTMVNYIMEKFYLKSTSNSYHIVFNQLPAILEQYNVFQIREVLPYNRVRV